MTGAEQFREFAAGHGFELPAYIEPGKIIRFQTNGKRGDDAGWARLFDDGLGGIVGDWRTGAEFVWQAKRDRQFTPEEKRAWQAKIEIHRRERDAELVRQYKDAQARAELVWKTSTPAPDDHVYLLKKGVKSHGLRVYKGALLVPRRIGNELHNLEYIYPDDEKRPVPGGRVNGCYFSMGRPDKVLCVAEGYATAASIHETTGHAVAVSFGSSNLLPVAKILRGKFPDKKIILCADIGNGQDEAIKAAQAINGFLAVPVFKDSSSSPSDFNDLHRLEGSEAVKAAIENAIGVSTTADAVQPDGVSLIRGSSIVPEAIRWIWKDWLSCGKFHIIAGAPGTGKTTIALALAATVTAGGRWPDGSRAEPKNILIWSGEDDVKDTLLPRLLAMGADHTRIYFVGPVMVDGKSRPFDPAKDIAELARVAAEIGGIGLIIVDPIVNAVPGDSNKNAETRRSLQPLVDLAQKLDACALGVSHFSKNTAGRNPVERVTGSVAFGALPRVVFGTAMTTDKEGHTERIFVRAKSNIGPDGGGFNYDLEQKTVPGHHALQASCLLWGRPLDGSAHELLSVAEQVDEERCATDEAIDFLRSILVGGPMKASEVIKEAREAGIHDKPLRRARERLGITPVKQSFSGGWEWSLSAPKMPQGTQDAQYKKVGIFDGGGHLRHHREADPDADGVEI